MFCSKCGKEIDYEADVCNECAAEAAHANEEAVEESVVATVDVTEEAVDVPVACDCAAAEEPEEFNNMYNFKPALTNTIVACVSGAISSAMASSFFASFYQAILGGRLQFWAPSIGAAILALVGGIAFGIVSIIFLTKSIPVLKDTIAYKNKHGKTPIAPFILSIVSVVLNAINLLSCVMYIISGFVGIGFAIVNIVRNNI